jgi:hypothetical protein
MKRIGQITLSILFIFSCILVTVNAQTSEVTIRPKVNRLVEKLKKDGEVHFGYAVGYGGKPETRNKYYKLYLKLESKATNDELVLLTRENFKTIVIYSFSILHSRAYKNLKDIFIEHSNDTAFYWTAGGCTGFVERVNWFMLRQLNPTSQGHNASCLTQAEYDTYCAKFKQQDKAFSCN